jgi:hypothetical protein
MAGALIVLVGGVGPAAFSFGIVLLLGALLEAGLCLPLNRSAALIRGAVLAGALVILLVRAPPAPVDPEVLRAFDSATAMLLAIMLFGVVGEAHAVRRRDEARRLDMLTTVRDLARATGDLRAARHGRRQLDVIAERVSDAIVVTDDDGRITWVNAAFTVQMGYAPDEVVGRNVAMLNGPMTDPAAIEALWTARAERRPIRIEIVNHARDGRPIWVETSLTPLLDDDGRLQAMIAIERDIGEAKAREEALAAAIRQADAARAARDAFLATISHEIRTPMNGVIGTADLLLETPLTESQRALVQTITASGDALLAIVNDVLDHSRLDSGRFTVAQDPFDPKACLQGAVDLLRPLAEAKGLALTIRWPEGALPLLVGDPGRLRQIVLNLAGNAIKFTEEGSVTVEVVHGGVPRALVVAVQDTGVGIPEASLERIFQRFAQADETVAGRFGGAGLGLSISRRLAEAMGGTLVAASTPGVGSVFTLRLPLPVAEDAAASLTDAGAYADFEALRDRTILIADDNRTSRMVLEKMLAPFGPRVLTASNGREAVTLCVRENPDLVFMDMRMPLLDGLEATREIRGIEALLGAWPCTIVALTASAFAEDRTRCLAAGMSDFLSKPFRRADLLALAVRHLEPRTRDGPDLSPAVSNARSIG